MAKLIHKFKRDLKSGDQFQLCTGEKINFAENASYLWRKVTCDKCKKRGGRYA